MKVRIEDWSVQRGPDRESDKYRAPEQRETHLHGKVFGHPNFEDGSTLVTSPMRRVVGREVHCASRVYLLGAPAEAYTAYCLEKGYQDPRLPPFILDKGAP